jgi:hypothetical protein
MIHKPFERTASTSSREECEFSTSYNLQCSVSYLKLAPCTSIIASGTKTEVGPTSTNILFDQSIALSIERSAIPQISASRKY